MHFYGPQLKAYFWVAYMWRALCPNPQYSGWGLAETTISVRINFDRGDRQKGNGVRLGQAWYIILVAFPFIHFYGSQLKAYFWVAYDIYIYICDVFYARIRKYSGWGLGETIICVRINYDTGERQKEIVRLGQAWYIKLVAFLFMHFYGPQLKAYFWVDYDIYMWRGRCSNPQIFWMRTGRDDNFCSN